MIDNSRGQDKRILCIIYNLYAIFIKKS